MSHFTQDERHVLAQCLKGGQDVGEISRILGKHRTSVCRELKRNRVKVGAGPDGCPLLDSPPYVCNTCGRAAGCAFQKWHYLPDSAHRNYRRVLVSSRDGFNLSEKELARINEIVARGTALGQSIHHILLANADEMTVSEKTLYRLVNSGMLMVRRHHLRMAARRKPRAAKLKERGKARERRIDRQCTAGRTREDFEAFVASKGGADVVEIDSVLGPKGSSKVLLTVNFNSCGLMLAFIRDANTARSVVDVLDRLEARLGAPLFRRLFPVLLTDNGSEFTNPAMMERGVDGAERTRVFYCHPYSASEKPHVENNHENLRKIFEKGLSFDRAGQDDVDLAVWHVNSMIRKEYGDRTAFERFRERYGAKAVRLLGLRLIPADQVCLTPKLLEGRLDDMR